MDALMNVLMAVQSIEDRFHINVWVTLLGFFMAPMLGMGLGVARREWIVLGLGVGLVALGWGVGLLGQGGVMTFLNSLGYGTIVGFVLTPPYRKTVGRPQANPEVEGEPQGVEERTQQPEVGRTANDPGEAPGV